jgi:predicted ATPase
MKIYFTERKIGKSVFRPVEVNDYGAIIDWPEGFFDQSQDEAEQIIREATKKRKMKNKTGKD